MEALLLSVAGCMAIDVLMILEKGRVPVEELEVVVAGDRAPEPPRRFTSLALEYRLRGPGEDDEAKIRRAIELSRDTYCSVLHTLRPDLELEVTFNRV
jgi:putative redox protein